MLEYQKIKLVVFSNMANFVFLTQPIVFTFYILLDRKKYVVSSVVECLFIIIKIL